MKVRAEVSLYPLRVDNLSELVESFLRDLSRNSLEVLVGPMSTRVSGVCDNVFSALHVAFEKAAGAHDVVMTVKISNACPEPADGV